MRSLIIATAILLLASVALAQTTYVNPNGRGGYTVQTPGQMPTYYNPNGRGGYVVQSPGQMPTYINPNGRGGYIIQSPPKPAWEK